MAMADTDLLELHSSSSSNSRDDRPRVVAVLSALLERAVSRNHAKQQQQQQQQQQMEKGSMVMVKKPATVFHGLRAPSISIHNYLHRIFKYANCSPACFVVAYAYIDRFIHQQPDVVISPLNVHRLLITSVMLAAKFLDDAYYNNAYYAKVGGVTTAEMNRLELQFLFRLDFRLQVTVSVFDSYCTHLEREVACCPAGHAYVDRPLLQVPPAALLASCGLDHSGNADKQQQPQLRHCSYAGL